MYEKQILAPGIVLYKTNSEFAKKIKNQIEETVDGKWDIAMAINPETGESIESPHRKCFDFTLHEKEIENSKKQKLYNEIYSWIKPAYEDFCSMYYIEETMSDIFLLLKYGESGKFDNHIDDGKKYPRTISLSAYVNDDYLGGEIEFNHFNVKYKPEIGDIIFFCSAFPYLHTVHPVLSGIRYAIVNWYRYKTYPKEWINS
jgi:hypothetical protein